MPRCLNGSIIFIYKHSLEVISNYHSVLHDVNRMLHIIKIMEVADMVVSAGRFWWRRSMTYDGRQTDDYLDD